MNGVFLVVGSVVLVYTVDLDAPELFFGSFCLEVLLLLLIVAAGRAYDKQQEERGPRALRSKASVPKEAL